MLDGNRAIRATVFASAAPSTAEAYTEAAHDLGTRLAKAGMICVFGGGNAGCMGALCDGSRAAGGAVHGITHEKFVGDSGFDMEQAQADGISLDIIQGDDLSQRKQHLVAAGHCLICLPGGVGTLDELFMCLAMVATKFRDLPIVIVNVDGYYDGTIAQMERAERDGLLRQPSSQLMTVVNTPAEAVEWCLANVSATHTVRCGSVDEVQRCCELLQAVPGVMSALPASAEVVCVQGRLNISASLRALQAEGVVARWEGATAQAAVASRPPNPPHSRRLLLQLTTSFLLGLCTATTVAAWRRGASRA